MWQNVVFVVAHSHAVGCSAYLALIELLEVVACELVEGGGNGAFLVFNTLFCTVQHFNKFMLCLVKIICGCRNVISVSAVAYFVVPSVFAAPAFV